MHEFYTGRLGSGTIGATPSSYPNRRGKPDEVCVVHLVMVTTLMNPVLRQCEIFQVSTHPIPRYEGNLVGSAARSRRLRVQSADASATAPLPKFKDLPAISLHVPCHFVICDTGEKLMSFYGGTRPTAEQLKLDFPFTFTPTDRFVLSAVWDLCEAWMCARPDAEWKSIVGQLTTGCSYGGGHDGPGGPSSHGGNEGDGSQGLLNENDGPPHGAPGGADAGDHPFVQPTSSLAPEDSASCRDVAGGEEESSEEAPADEDEGVGGSRVFCVAGGRLEGNAGGRVGPFARTEGAISLAIGVISRRLEH